MNIRTYLLGAIVLAFSGAAQAETVYLKDGTVRKGTVRGRSDTELALQVNVDGLRATVIIPLDQILRIDRDTDPIPVRPPATAPSTAPSTASSTTHPADHTKPLGTAPATTAPAAHKVGPGFFKEFIASALGHGPDDPARLPADQRALWNGVLEADASGDKTQLLAAMGLLESAVRKDRLALATIEKVCTREKDISFGKWMGQVRWAIISQKFRDGQFDLHDVRDIEKKTLIAILRTNTAPAIDPVRGFFPPLRDGVMVPFNASQLAGISAGNCLEIKERTLYASAVLSAQLKLEPDMPTADHNLLTTQLVLVRRILAKALEYEPQAHIIQAREERDRKLAEERAKHPPQ